MSVLGNSFDSPKPHGETKTQKRPRTDDYDLPDHVLIERGWKQHGRFLIAPPEESDDDEEHEDIQYTLRYVKHVEDSILQLEHSMKNVRHDNAQHKRILIHKLEELRRAKQTIDRKIDELENTVITLISALDN